VALWSERVFSVKHIGHYHIETLSNPKTENEKAGEKMRRTKETRTSKEKLHTSWSARGRASEEAGQVLTPNAYSQSDLE
jgi:hypothetical protein